MESLLFDCRYGVSGDMIVGALLDLGADERVLKVALKSLNLKDYDIKISKINKKGTPATDFDVVLKEDNHDHDMAYLYGNKKVKFKEKEERNLPVIEKLIDNAQMTPKAKILAKRMFNLVAKAEALAHKIPIEKVIFHEVGAMDSIIDIVSIAVCVDNLNVENVYVKNLREGKGHIMTRGGLLPIPTPAVRNVLSMYGAKVEECDLNVELITPTGICALAIISNFQEMKNEAQVVKVGYGSGKRNYDLPCVLKAERVR